eukprot:m.91245 g.91245  ORF g.91245 m.91245 type:complete len:52 (+) comp8487_c1_seq7:332-487(+)
MTSGAACEISTKGIVAYFQDDPVETLCMQASLSVCCVKSLRTSSLTSSRGS